MVATTTGAAVERRSSRAFALALAAVSLVPFVAGPAMASAGLKPAAWSIAVVILGAPHVGATLAFYVDDEIRRDRARFYVWPVLAVAVGMAVALAPDVWRAYAIAAFLGWQLHHFTRQNLGCFAFLCRARRAPGPTPIERRVLDLTTVAAVCAIPAALIDEPLVAERVLLRVGAIVLVIAAGLAWRCRSDDAVRSAALVFAIAFYLPLFLFEPGPALLGYGLAHGAQYLLMVGHLPAGRANPRRMALAVVGGVGTVGLALHWAMGHTYEPIVFGLFYGLTAAHFLVDAGVWKMRTPEQREYMRRRFSFLQ